MTTRPPAEVGMPVAEIDTPALVVDLDAYEHNLDLMAATLRGTAVRLRGHAKTHKCPTVALHQITRRGRLLLPEGERGRGDGRRGRLNVLVSNEIVDRRKIERLVALARRAEVLVCVDDPRNVDDPTASAHAAGVRLGVLVEIDVGNARCGVAPGEAAVALARHVAVQLEPPLRRPPGLLRARPAHQRGREAAGGDRDRHRGRAAHRRSPEAPGARLRARVGGGDGQLPLGSGERRLQRGAGGVLLLHGRRVQPGRGLPARVPAVVLFGRGDEPPGPRARGGRRRPEGAVRRQGHAGRPRPRRRRVPARLGRQWG